jgi:hypothetical protein
VRSALTLVLCLAFGAVALAQTGGTIIGTVTEPDGTAVQGAPIQARDKASGATFRTLSSATGEYSLQPLPAGTYELTLRMPGFKFKRFLQSDVVIASGQNRRIAIGLEIGNLDTYGDDPFTFLADIRAKSAGLTGPVPRTADGRPDLSGVWNGNDDLYPEDPALLPWAAAVVKERVQNDLRDLPRGQCLPAGVVPTGPFFRKLVQTPGLVLFINENDVLGFRQIFLDGRDHPKDLVPTWQGHAVGRWDGDTLVVDVNGFNEASFMGIAPHTQQLHITERYRRRDFGHMEVQVTADDPGTLSKPWTINMVWDLALEQEILEFVCTENIANIHLEWRTPRPAR